MEQFINWRRFDRDAFSHIGGPILTSVPVGHDPLAWYQYLIGTPTIVALRCDPVVQGAGPPSY